MLRYFSWQERLLWAGSVLGIVGSFLLFRQDSALTLVASLIGVTSLLFIAKGNPVGQFMTIVFSLIYGVISYTFHYYGEMLTYLCMTMPMAAASLVAWLKNPYQGNKSEVKVDRLSRADIRRLCLLAVGVTAAFFFILRHFQTPNLLPSTLSVTTSFVAVYLTFCRSPLYAIAYAANDLVLILLWSLAAATDMAYWSVVVCFLAFFANDIYGFISWSRMEKRQTTGQTKKSRA